MLGQKAVAPLTILPARAIGLMTMMDAGKRDHKIIAIATGDPEFNGYLHASDLPRHRLLVLRRFFQDYKQLENRLVEVEEITPVKKALRVIEEALQRYSKQRQRGF